jgi:hypothetical protein
VIVPDSSAKNKVFFAYDTTTYPAALRIDAG